MKYARALRRAMRDFTTDAISWVSTRADANLPGGFDEHITGLLLRLQQRVGPLFDRHARDVSRLNKRGLAAVGVKASDLGLDAEIAKRRDENIQLVANAGREYAQSVAEIFGEPSTIALRVEELKADLVERGNVSESRAELIARDQTLKLNGAITQIRQENAGITEYIWSTSLDERVRETHAALEGQRFAWGTAPEVGHPGQDFQCRCVALPVIAELEGL